MCDWNASQPTFCEGIISGSPEYFNSFSSLFLAIFGLYGLLKNNLRSPVLDLAYSVLIVCSVGSFGFHWTLNRGWSYMDQIPMNLIQLLGIGQILHIVLPRKYILLLPVLIGLNIFTIVLSTMPSIKRTEFADLFTIQFLPIILGMLYARFISHKHLKEIPAYPNCWFKSEGKVYSLMWRTIIIWCVSGLLWNFYERLCIVHTWLRFIPIHPLWHFLSGYGALLILQTAGSISENTIMYGYWLPILH
jgi:hypothetical protein